MSFLNKVFLSAPIKNTFKKS